MPFVRLVVIFATAALAGSAAAPAAISRCDRTVVLLDARTGAVRDYILPRATVSSAVADGRGGWYVGGDFSRFGAPSAIVHLDHEGKVDRGFGAKPAPAPVALAGDVLYGGGWNEVAALDAASGRRLWTTHAVAHASAGVSGVAYADGVLYVVGTFVRIGGVSRDGVAALDARSGRLLPWSVKVRKRIPGTKRRYGNVLTVAVAGTTVYLGGQFERLGARPRYNLGAVDARTGRVTSWRPEAVADYVDGMIVTHGQVLAGGHGFFAAYSARTGRALAWASRLHIAANRFAVSGQTVYLGGNLRDGFNRIGYRVANNLGAVKLPSGRVTAWTPNLNREVSINALAVSGDTVLAGGLFTSSTAC